MNCAHDLIALKRTLAGSNELSCLISRNGQCAGEAEMVNNLASQLLSLQT